MGTKTNVVIFAPSKSVKSMQDEIVDGSVEAAIVAAKAAYTGIDSDGNVPVKYYDEDFDNGVEAANNYAATTDGNDLIVLITDFECNDRPKAERLLQASDDMYVLVPVSNQGYDTAWADKLDGDNTTAKGNTNGVDVITVDGLANPKTANAEVELWLNGATV